MSTKGLPLLLSGAFTVTLGVLVIFGWVFQVRELVQILPSHVPMQFATAVFFVLSGLTCLAILRAWKLQVSITAILLLGAATVALLQFFFGKQLSIDDVFSRINVSAEKLEAGHMSLTPIILFMIAAIQALFTAHCKCARLRSWIQYVSISALLCLPLVSIAHRE